MTLIPERSVHAERHGAHAKAIAARGAALPAEGLPSAQILDSWVRCMQGGLDLASTRPVGVVPAHELAQRRERAASVRRLARAELETLAQQIAGSNYLLAFADRDGVILDLYADNRFSMSGPNAGIVAGSNWSEALCGTNGLGTALRTGQATAVTGLEHYLLRLGEVSCSACPVRDASGEIVGVLDASSYYESRQRHTLALVQMAATHIENGLLLHQMRSAWVLALHPRPEFLSTLSAGLLAFDGGGRLLAINARGQQLLQGLDTRLGSHFEALFGEPFERVPARLTHGTDARVRDVLGSVLAVACVGRPPVAAAATLAATEAGAAAKPRSAGHLAALAHEGATAGPTLRSARQRTQVGEVAILQSDPAVAEAYRLADAAARLSVPILIQGETGSGKEVLARHVHHHSGRNGAFVAVNCGAMPGELFEAELFGYAGGAFTGARRDGSPGLIASAHGGTLLLDELADLPARLQAALLRFLDDKLVRPVGGSAQRKVEVLLLGATNTELRDAVAAGRFRADLLYRLDTVRIILPPLRHRSDFATSVHGILSQLSPGTRITDEAVTRLARHAWPGNFRELRAVLTRALLATGHSQGQSIGVAQVDTLLPVPVPVPVPVPAPKPAPGAACDGSALQQNASDLVRREFDRTGHSITQTSRNLGISRTTVYRHLRGAV